MSCLYRYLHLSLSALRGRPIDAHHTQYICGLFWSILGTKFFGNFGTGWGEFSSFWTGIPGGPVPMSTVHGGAVNDEMDETKPFAIVKKHVHVVHPISKWVISHSQCFLWLSFVVWWLCLPGRLRENRTSLPIPSLPSPSDLTRQIAKNGLFGQNRSPGNPTDEC